MVELSKQIEELLMEEPMCPICLCTLVKPIKLKCGHWLCILCSTELVDSGPNDVAKCPLCRQEMEPNFQNKKVNKMLDDEIKQKYSEAYNQRVAVVEIELKKHQKGKRIIFEYGNTWRNEGENKYKCKFYFELPNKDVSTFVENVEVILPFSKMNFVLLEKPPFHLEINVYGVFNIRFKVRWKRWLEREPTVLDHFVSFKEPDNRQRLIIRYDADWK